MLTCIPYLVYTIFVIILIFLLISTKKSLDEFQKGLILHLILPGAAVTLVNWLHINIFYVSD